MKILFGVGFGIWLSVLVVVFRNKEDVDWELMVGACIVILSLLLGYML